MGPVRETPVGRRERMPATHQSTAGFFTVGLQNALELQKLSIADIQQRSL